MLTKADVLEYLDNCVYDPGCSLMDLEHGYFHTANSRLSLFSDGSTPWAIVFEKSGYANRGGRIDLELNYFGNCLHSLEPGGSRGQFPYNAKYFELVSPSTVGIKVRDQIVALPPTPQGYVKWFPEGDADNDEPASFEQLAIYLAFEYEALCRATLAELRTCIPADLPFVMHIDQWHHRHYYYFENGDDKRLLGEKPSSYETYPMIAEVLVKRDPALWRPTPAATNHWTNWPGAGRM